MIDRKKAIKGLEELQAWLKHLQTVRFHGDIPEYRERELTVSDVLALLRKQEAIEPREQEETRTWTVCGNCSQHLISKWLWCPYCGKAVKWNA